MFIFSSLALAQKAFSGFARIKTDKNANNINFFILQLLVGSLPPERQGNMTKKSRRSLRRARYTAELMIAAQHRTSLEDMTKLI
jgi:hypothetical protein